MPAPSSTTTPIASLEHVTLRYEHGVTALDDVSVSIAEGERMGLGSADYNLVRI